MSPAGGKHSVSTEALPTANGYSNNFGHPRGGAGYRGVEGVLMAYSMKTFISRCVASTKELYNSDNIVSKSIVSLSIGQFEMTFGLTKGGSLRNVIMHSIILAN